MFSKLRPRSIYDVMAAIGCFAALAGGTAYAANEWNGSNIQDETLTGADVKGRPGSFSAPAVDGSLTGNDISGQAANAGNHTPFVDGSLTNADVKNGTLLGIDVLDNTLTGADIDESTLNLPNQTVTTFASSDRPITLHTTAQGIAHKAIPPGNWAIVATVNTEPVGAVGDRVTDVNCSLEDVGNFIGGAQSRGIVRKSLSMNGGAYLPPGHTDVISVDCNSNEIGVESATAQIMFTRVGGFF